jgi:hypothetical protein
MVVSLSSGSIDDGDRSLSAQLLPLPPPFSGNVAKSELKSENEDIDVVPPSIDLLNDALVEGKNVLKVRIVDASNIDKCKVTHTIDNEIKIVDCVWDTGEIYKALIATSVSPSGQDIEIYVKDINGNSRTSSYTIPVDDRVSSFFNFFQNLIPK